MHMNVAAPVSGAQFVVSNLACISCFAAFVILAWHADQMLIYMQEPVC